MKQKAKMFRSLPLLALALISMTILGVTVPLPLLAVEAGGVTVALHENRVDACTSCGCRSTGIVNSGESGTWWGSFGLVEPAEDGGWKRRGPAALSYCGRGRFDEVRNAFYETEGIPYAIVEIQVRLISDESDKPSLEVEWSVETLESLNRRGKPRYQPRAIQSPALPVPGSESAVTVFTAGDREMAEFGIYEVMASVSAQALAGDSSAYGTIALEGDYPGAEIMLAGGLLGRIAEDETVLLEGIPAGQWNLEVRDYSGKTSSQHVEVVAGGTTAVSFDVIDEEAEGATDAFIPLGTNPQGFEERWRKQDSAVSVLIPAGIFLMGSDEPSSPEDERPAHEVYVDQFWMDKTEVTWRQFQKFAKAEGRTLPPEPQWGRPDYYALSATTWEEGADYCEWVGGRLPTEAEWEKAARGTDGRKYPWGNQWDPNKCNSISGGLHQPEPVGSFHGCISPYGVLDVLGSHWQWLSDYYAEDYYSQSPAENPRGPESGTARTRRGGYWMNHPPQLEISRRSKAAPDWRYLAHGFRCAQDAVEEGQ
jgi:sulfatase modifying factor 1